jgi:hypothetical protein
VLKKPKPKLTPARYAARFKAEQALQQRRYCDAFGLWKTCRRNSCRRLERCGGDQHACLQRTFASAPHDVQWRVRQHILAATPRNIGKPERAARQCMPGDFYE